MSSPAPEDLYNGRLIGMLERVWGEGWLSPGGPGEVGRLLEGIGISGKHGLDIGCGAGCADILAAGT